MANRLNKYYVTFGEFLLCINAINESDACVKTFKAFLKRDADKEADAFQGAVVSLPSKFVVSERGFDLHNEDKIISTATIYSMMENLRKEHGFEQDV